MWKEKKIIQRRRRGEKELGKGKKQSDKQA